jgi:PAP2 superfamily
VPRRSDVSHELDRHQQGGHCYQGTGLVVSLRRGSHATRRRRYAAIAGTSTPSLDRGLHRLSRAANYSRLSLSSAAVMALIGGRRGRQAAGMGPGFGGRDSAALNAGVKPIVRRRRPDRVAEDVPLARHVRMPSSSSFPSGHSAAAFAFATGVAHVLPAGGVSAARPLRRGCLFARAHGRPLSQRRTCRGDAGRGTFRRRQPMHWATAADGPYPRQGGRRIPIEGRRTTLS